MWWQTQGTAQRLGLRGEEISGARRWLDLMLACVNTYFMTDADRSDHERLASLARFQDPLTFELLQAHFPSDSNLCAEIGAGAGTVAQWLCRRVAPTGRVVATDLDVKWLRSLDEPNLEVREHDITAGPVGSAEFDFIFARAVLGHVNPAVGLANMVASLRSGGRLFVEDIDFGTAFLVYPPVGAFERFWEGVTAVMRAAGGDPHIGRKLPHLLQAAGLTEVQAKGTVTLEWTDDGYHASVEPVVPRLVAASLLSPEDGDIVSALPRGRDRFLFGVLRMSAWGRKL